MNPIIMELWMFLAIISLTLIIGVVAGIKASRIHFILQIIKKIPPKEFEKLLEENNEGRKYSPDNP